MFLSNISEYQVIDKAINKLISEKPKAKLANYKYITWKIRPTIVVPVLRKDGSGTPFLESISFRLHKSKLNPHLGGTSTAAWAIFNSTNEPTHPRKINRWKKLIHSTIPELGFNF